MTILASILLDLAWPPVGSFGVTMIFDRTCRAKGASYDRRKGYVSGWITQASVLLGLDLAQRHWADGAGAGLSLLIALAIWWYRRRKRRSALALIGAKAKAIRDRLAQTLKESAKPRPVLRPLPGGAR